MTKLFEKIVKSAQNRKIFEDQKINKSGKDLYIDEPT